MAIDSAREHACSCDLMRILFDTGGYGDHEEASVRTESEIAAMDTLSTIFLIAVAVLRFTCIHSPLKSSSFSEHRWVIPLAFTVLCVLGMRMHFGEGALSNDRECDGWIGTILLPYASLAISVVLMFLLLLFRRPASTLCRYWRRKHKRHSESSRRRPGGALQGLHFRQVPQGSANVAVRRRRPFGQCTSGQVSMTRSEEMKIRVNWRETIVLSLILLAVSAAVNVLLLVISLPALCAILTTAAVVVWIVGTSEEQDHDDSGRHQTHGEGILATVMSRLFPKGNAKRDLRRPSQDGDSGDTSG